MTDRRTVDSVEYKEGYNSAKVNSGVVAAHNPYIVGTSSWHRWNVGWNDYSLEDLTEEEEMEEFKREARATEKRIMEEVGE